MEADKDERLKGLRKTCPVCKEAAEVTHIFDNGNYRIHCLSCPVNVLVTSE